MKLPGTILASLWVGVGLLGTGLWAVEPPVSDGRQASPLPAALPSVAARTNSEIPRFAVNSPFGDEYQAPVLDEGKRLWARSCLYEKLPELSVEKWLKGPPETRGKHLLIEFWATWCSPCRRSIPLLNDLQRRFTNDLVVIGVSDEGEQAVRDFKGPALEYYSGVDTQGRLKKTVGVIGIPHALLVEPGGHVVWEGFPLLKGHELSEATVEKILRVGRRRGAAEKSLNLSPGK